MVLLMIFPSRGLGGCSRAYHKPAAVATGLGDKAREGRDGHDNLPILNMTYDGQEQGNIMTRLEAFMYQTKQYQVQHRAWK
jgi:hypothetical protein